MIHAIDDEIDVRYLEALKDRLFSEQRMSGDAMRDAANRLHILLGRLVELDERDPRANVFERTPDARQSDDETLPVSRFRPRYRAMDDEELALHDTIKDKADELDELFNRIKDGRYKALAVTSLEQSVMWAIKGLTA
jgi:hypothetical protein